MTVLDGRPGGATGIDAALTRGADPDEAPRLWQLVGARRGWLDVVVAAGGLDRPLRGATIWEPALPPGPRQVVLVTAPRLDAAGLAEVLATAARVGAAAVLVRQSHLRGRVGPGGRAIGPAVPVLTLADHVAWEDAAALVCSLVSSASLGVPGGRPTTPGLYELAEAAALALDGAVVITDADLRVLAFAIGDQVDELTTETILTRRAARPLRERFEPVRRRRGVTVIDLPGAGRRLVAPVLVRDVVAGHVFLAPGTGSPETAVGILGDVASAAVAWFSDEPAGDDGEDAVRTELLRGVLTGSGSLEALTGRLGRAAGTWRLVALGAHGSGREGLPGAGERPLARCARMLEPSSAAVVVGGTGFVLAPDPSGLDAPRLAELVRRRGPELVGAPLVACVGEPLAGAEDARATAGTLRAATVVLAARPDPVTTDLVGLRPHVVIAELAGLAAEHPALLGGALDVLRYDESPRGREYLTSLLGWFDARCDVSRAAVALQVHRNTLRYRLQRIEQLCAVDLDDALQRFTLELQLRVLALHGGW